jgi:hypothetical protein
VDFLDLKPRRRQSPEINLTPILDMLVSIIFFLLIFCVFSEYSQVSLPAVKEATNSVTDSVLLSPKILVRSLSNGRVRFDLLWAGEHPGRQTQEFGFSQLNSADTWMTAMKKFSENFAKQYPRQKSIEVGLEGQFSYQHLLYVIDALADRFPDVALINPKKVVTFQGRL